MIYRLPFVGKGGAMALGAGSRVGRYVLRRTLAEGGMATVYLAEARGVEGFAKAVALKVIHDFLGTNPQFVAMFVSEARIACSLNHVNLVNIFDFGRHANIHFLVMEYVRGTTLQILRRYCRERCVAFPPVLAAEICAQVARGLHAAHSADLGGGRVGIIHRDVSPHNILLSYEGAVKLTDFGIAKVGHARTVPGVLKGKFAYMAPEQARGDAVDARTDVFALGIILWELLTGARLFDAASEVAVLRAVQESVIPPPNRVNPDVSPQLSSIAMRALERDPASRFQSARELDRTLTDFVLGHAQRAEDVSVSGFLEKFGVQELDAANRNPTEEPKRKSQRPRSARLLRRRKVVVAMGVLALASAAGTSLVLKKAPAEPATPDSTVAGAMETGLQSPAVAASFPSPPEHEPLLADSAAEARLEASSASLVIRAIPYAVVSANEKELGEVVGVRTFHLSPGNYRITLQRHRTRRTVDVALLAGQSTSVGW